ncbi:hypothetical protein [Nonomuraea sp. CA-141351]|uniref:hypothetical protein n=1 Tax=Nonomuraea sp. CA-141351 TaxID=3239996 RepID=UPI003D90DF7B
MPLSAGPLVADFGRCFEGVSPQEAERPASCFAFIDCENRGPLTGTLRSHLAGA